MFLATYVSWRNEKKFLAIAKVIAEEDFPSHSEGPLEIYVKSFLRCVPTNSSCQTNVVKVGTTMSGVDEEQSTREFLGGKKVPRAIFLLRDEHMFSKRVCVANNCIRRTVSRSRKLSTDVTYHLVCGRRFSRNSTSTTIIHSSILHLTVREFRESRAHPRLGELLD